MTHTDHRTARPGFRGGRRGEPGRLRLLAAVLLGLAGPAASAADAPANTWRRIAEGPTGRARGAVLVAAGPAGRLLHFGGEADGGGPYMRAFDPAAAKWSDFSAAKPPARRGVHPYYQTAYDPVGRKLYCLSNGPMYTFDLATKKWASHGLPKALEGLSWPVAAIDPAARKLVVVGADKKADNLGWTRTVILDLGAEAVGPGRAAGPETGAGTSAALRSPSPSAGQWSTLPLPPAPIVREHRQLVAAREAIIGLVGRIRMAWYRDPAGRADEAERKALVERCAAVGKMPAVSASAEAVGKVSSLLAAAKTLDALNAAKVLLRSVDEAADRQVPVPASRRNSPVVFDPSGRVFVLFGGDHEDYLMNDTWVLDLSKRAWRRAKPQAAPTPRAGHGMVSLPGGRIALYGGYVQSSSPDYGTRAWREVEPRQLWLYEIRRESWKLWGRWDRKRAESAPPGDGGFYGYHAQHYSPPALAVDAKGRLVLAAGGDRRQRGATWALRPAATAAAVDATARKKLSAAPDQRLYRTGRFRTAYCDVAVAPKPPDLSSLPPNRWVRLPDPPRNVAYGCRQRDWGTAVWDAANDQILLWGGGHCVRSASVVIHWSPASGRMVEGYDADEPYSANGNGGFDSSLLGRPWAGVHSYNTYAFDPPSGRMVSARGYFYDPPRMDWLRLERSPRPFRYVWSATVLEATPHGAVAWASTAADADRIGLWRLDARAGWVDLKPAGRLFKPYCDSEGLTYDARRDRLVFGYGGGYNRAGDGRLTTFDFKTRRVAQHVPAAAELARIRNTREMVYVDHADWIAFAEPYVPPTRTSGGRYLRIYDCAADRYFLLDAGMGPACKVHGQGWCHDAKRKVVYVITVRGQVWAIRFDPASARLLSTPPAEAQTARKPPVRFPTQPF